MDVEKDSYFSLDFFDNKRHFRDVQKSKLENIFENAALMSAIFFASLLSCLSLMRESAQAARLKARPNRTESTDLVGELAGCSCL